MNSCATIKELLVFHAEGILDREGNRAVEDHLAGCSECRAEATKIARIRGWLAEPELFAPSGDLTWELLPQRLAGRARAEEEKWSWRWMRTPKWAMSAAAILVFAAGMIWTLRLAPWATPPAKPVLMAAGNEAFIKKMRTAYAREATAQYLTGCQDLLLDLVSSEKKCEGDLHDVSLEVTRARQLLGEKRLLDAELLQPEGERARGLCDELERFLIGLSTSRNCESTGAIEGMGRAIEKDQLLLRINLLQTGIS